MTIYSSKLCFRHKSCVLGALTGYRIETPGASKVEVCRAEIDRDNQADR